MKKRAGVVALILIPAYVLAGGRGANDRFEQRLRNISSAEMQAVVEFLGHDLLEGRSPGSRGGDLAEIYIRSLFKMLDLEPAGTNGYMQPFILKKFTTSGIQLAAGDVALEYIHDLVGTATCQTPDFNISAPLVFVGFGIRAQKWNWDDYKDADVSGKILVSRVNDPGSFHPQIFEGKTLTYFGRWTYHIEEAARRKALGILLIHTDESAGYGWKVVENSWTNGEFFIPAQIDNPLVFRGWIKEKSLERLLASKGVKLADLYRQSLTTEFKPVDLGIQAAISGRNQWQDVENRNVVASVSGKVPQRIVLSAHIDHLGTTNTGGDRIFNGAIDNGSAVAAMLVAAKILKEFQDDLYYSITVLACNSEEAGLLGSRFYVDTTDRSNIIANINFESSPVWKPATSLMGIGARFSTFAELIRQTAADHGLTYSQFSLANQGLFYRSDQFSFARRGIPAVWISAGETEVDGERHYTRFWLGDYHTVRDEYDPEWDLGGLRQTIQAALRLVRRMNENRVPPQWKNNLTFPIENEAGEK
ncbi:MAG: M28 family peptidase [Acidobacteriota bacterium]|jgi:Zn-dependent M28 family amino/carboxypeptidase|nr:M28 family peptidase [Acidobacteriota bacterium]